MPIYEYKCQKCGSHIERRQRVSDAPLQTCESCGGQLEKQWSRTGFQFKGEGWYVTDYAGKKSSSSEGGEKSSPPESTATADGASNSKTESSSPSKSDSGTKKE